MLIKIALSCFALFLTELCVCVNYTSPSFSSHDTGNGCVGSEVGNNKC